jgi:molybdenum cofactor guanylyltransferase
MSPLRRGALVLVGGRSTRMGRDKATLPFRGHTLLEHVLERLAPCVGERLVVARAGQALPPLPDGVGRVDDRVQDAGPLAGLAAGLAAADSEVLYVTACDAPGLVPAFVALLFERLGSADVAVAEARGRLHPLAAVYRRSVLPEVEALLASGLRRMHELLERRPTVRVGEADLRKVDPALASLQNLNTPEDLESAQG